jgi:signal peptidase I
MKYLTRDRIWRFIREMMPLLIFFALIELTVPRFLVAGPSMQPTFQDDQRLIVSRIHYLFGGPERGDLVVFSSPESGIPLIKRIIGMPGDRVELLDTELYLNGVLLDEPYISEPCQLEMCPARSWSIGPDEYFVMGDNRNHSNDSRSFGPIKKDTIIGEALVRYWPPQDWALLKQLHYAYVPMGDD